MDERIGTLAWIHPREAHQEALSLASRLAGLNGRPMGEFLQEMGVSAIGLARSDPDDIRKLARLAGVDATLLLHDTAVRSIDRRYWLLRGERLIKRSIVRQRFRFCPKCLQDDLATVDGPLNGRPWLRTEWTVQNIRSCLRHRIPLVDAATDGGRWRMYDFLAAVEPILPKLSTIADESREIEPSGFEEWIVDRLNGNRSSKPWLDSLELHVGVDFCERLGVSTSFPPKTKLSKLTVAESREAADVGFLLASKGPSAIEAALDDLNERQKRSRGIWSPSDTFGELYFALQRVGNDPAWKAPSDLVAEFVLRSMPLEPGTVVLGRTVERQTFHTIRSATKLSGMHAKTIRTLLKGGSIDVRELESGVTDHRVRIDAPELEETLIALRGSISAQDARRRTRFPFAWFRTAIADGHLPVVTKSETISLVRGRFAGDAVDEMMTRMFVGAEVVHATTERRLGLQTVQRRTPTTMSRLLEIAFGPTTVWKGRLSTAQGFDSLLLDLDEIRSIVRSETVGTGLGMRAVARFILGLKSGSATRLASRGLLEIEYEFNPAFRRKLPVVTRASAQRFKATYVTLGELCRVTGTAAVPMRNRLRDANVGEAFTTKSYGFTGYIRSEAEGALGLDPTPPRE